MSSRKRGKDDSHHHRGSKKRGSRSSQQDPPDDNHEEQASILPILFNIGSFIPPSNDDPGDESDSWRPRGKIAAIRDRILKSGMEPKLKEQIVQRLKSINEDKAKHIEWFESLLRVPFGKLATVPVNAKSETKELNDYFAKVQTSLDESVYGMAEVKEEMLNYIAQFISSGDKTMPRVLGLCGSPGVGKTIVIRKGLSFALNRPMVTFSCGGIKDSAYLAGFQLCYSGSRFGRIAQGLMESEVINPIFFFDELDKVSDTCDGRDIANMLIHLTDPSQNFDYQDKYFDGVRIDLSKAVFVFSYNDSNLIHPVLKDRIHEIKVPSPTEDEKVIIGTKYLLKEVGSNIGFQSGDIVCPDDVMRYIIKEYCKNDKGVRPLKQCIETILMKINTARYYAQSKYKSLTKEPIKLPYTLTEAVVKELLKKKEDTSHLSYPSMYI